MRTFCDYHPTKPAHFNCSRCIADFCPGCVTKRSFPRYGRDETYYYCPKCEGIADRLSISNVIDPFWVRLPKFFIYPFHPRPLVLMLLLSAAVVFLVSKPGLMSLLLILFLLGVWVKYCHAALKNTAHARYYPPKVNSETIFDDFMTVIKQVVVFIIIGAAVYMVYGKFGRSIGFAFSVVAEICIYSMIIVLVATNSLMHAIYPVVFITMMWRIGWGYLLMYFFLGFLKVAPLVVQKYLIAYIPTSPYVLLFLSIFAGFFYTLISYHMMGYVLLQYHEDIGYEVDLDEEDSILKEKKPEQSEGSGILNRVDILIKEGKIDDAIFLIKSETRGNISDLELAERYYNLLKIKQSIPDLLGHAVTYLDLLSIAKEKEKLCEVYSECVSHDPKFVPSTTTLFRVASCLNEAGNPKAAINTYNSFIKANPKDPLIPKAYFLAANIINEKLRNPSRAAGILKSLIKAYPNDEITPHAQKYLRQLTVAQ